MSEQSTSAVKALAHENETLHKLLEHAEAERIKMAVFALSNLNRGEMYKLAQQNLTLAEMFAGQARKLLDAHPLRNIGPIRQYYYQVNGCNAGGHESPKCICWHDEGTGPLAFGEIKPNSWRLKPD